MTFYRDVKCKKSPGAIFTRNIHVARLTAAKAVQNGNPAVLWTAERRSRRDFWRMLKTQKRPERFWTANGGSRSDILQGCKMQKIQHKAGLFGA